MGWSEGNYAEAIPLAERYVAIARQRYGQEHTESAIAIAWLAMHWGEDNSVGHYLDLGSAVLGLTLFPIGYLLHAVKKISR